MPKFQVTNNRRTGSWSIITAGGTRSFQAGTSRDVEMTEDEAENGKADGIEIVKANGEKSAPAPAKATEPDDDMAALRAEYEAKVGKKPFMGWDADKLREKMAGAE